MSRVSMFNSPLLLGFDQLERTLDRLAKNAEGYPPYNIERIGENGLRITLAVAGFTSDDLAIELVENQLVGARQADRRYATGSSCIAASPPASSSAPSCWPTASR